MKKYIYIKKIKDLKKIIKKYHIIKNNFFFIHIQLTSCCHIHTYFYRAIVAFNVTLGCFSVENIH